jgi:hypothetical protein
VIAIGKLLPVSCSSAQRSQQHRTMPGSLSRSFELRATVPGISAESGFSTHQLLSR